MSETNRPNSTEKTTPGEATPIELLVGRLIDGEADPADFARLAELAAGDASVWRIYAEQRQSAALLNRRVAAELDAAARIPLPRHGGGLLTPVIGVVRASHGYLAWAALVTLALVIGLSDRTPVESGVQVVDRGAIEPGPVLSSDEFDPVLLHTEPLPDGRVRVTWMRRIIEVLDLDEFDPNLDVRREGESDVFRQPPPSSH